MDRGGGALRNQPLNINRPQAVWASLSTVLKTILTPCQPPVVSHDLGGWLGVRMDAQAFFRDTHMCESGGGQLADVMHPCCCLPPGIVMRCPYQ